MPTTIFDRAEPLEARPSRLARTRASRTSMVLTAVLAMMLFAGGQESVALAQSDAEPDGCLVELAEPVRPAPGDRDNRGITRAESARREHVADDGAALARHQRTRCRRTAVVAKPMDDNARRGLQGDDEPGRQ